jgi:hypothetical protein
MNFRFKLTILLVIFGLSASVLFATAARQDKEATNYCHQQQVDKKYEVGSQVYANGFRNCCRREKTNGVCAEGFLSKKYVCKCYER